MKDYVQIQQYAPIAKLLALADELEAGEKPHITRLLPLRTHINHNRKAAILVHLCHFSALHLANGTSLTQQHAAPVENKVDWLNRVMPLCMHYDNEHASGKPCGTSPIANLASTLIKPLRDELLCIHPQIFDLQRTSVHISHFRLADPELAMLIFLLRTNSFNYPSLCYWLAQYYCVSYSDQRYRLDKHSATRVRELATFLSASQSPLLTERLIA